MAAFRLWCIQNKIKGSFMCKCYRKGFLQHKFIQENSIIWHFFGLFCFFFTQPETSTVQHKRKARAVRWCKLDLCDIKVILRRDVLISDVYCSATQTELASSDNWFLRPRQSWGWSVRLLVFGAFQEKKKQNRCSKTCAELKAARRNPLYYRWICRVVPMHVLQGLINGF